jgi:hypothetical protein
MKEKECKGKRGCNLIKSIEEFRIVKSLKSGRSNLCIACIRKQDRERSTTDEHRTRVNKHSSLPENKRKQKIRNREYYSIEENRDKILERQSSREVRDRNNELQNIRRREDEKANLSHRISSGIRASIRKDKEGKSWKDVVSFSLEELISHLKENINNVPGANWQDFLDAKLHLDHIRPVCSFNYKTFEDLEFKECWNINNFQLLPSSINHRKSGRWDGTPENVRFNLKYITLAELQQNLDDDIV